MKSKVPWRSSPAGDGGFTLDAFPYQAGPAADGMVTATFWARHVEYSGARESHEKDLKRFGESPDDIGAEDCVNNITTVRCGEIDALTQELRLSNGSVRRRN